MSTPCGGDNGDTPLKGCRACRCTKQSLGGKVEGHLRQYEQSRAPNFLATYFFRRRGKDGATSIEASRPCTRARARALYGFRGPAPGSSAQWRVPQSRFMQVRSPPAAQKRSAAASSLPGTRG